ncbi:MAG: protein kinase [Gemmatimonadaceae bacterium]|nr:protein kinase [Gemmatimonadaceae bacterium]
MDDLRPRLERALEGAYIFERELGGGGMSRTYLVRERALDRRVVVKVLAPELLAGISVERFRREVLMAAKLQHPHVVPVLTAGDVDGLPWFTMPYVDGDSLRQRLGHGPMSITEIVSVLRDVARALTYAHANGIVHRDIKPDNVLLSAGSATVTDFGIAKAISAARTTGDAATPNTMLTVAGTSIGTPTYMAPEQAAGDPATDHRADLYSFGAMAYELLTGRPPFHGLTPARMLAAHLGEAPKDVRSLRTDCPETLAELVMRCLEKDPASRPQQALDLVRVLDTITSSGAAVAAPAILSGGRINLGKALALWGVGAVLVSLTVWAATKVIGLPDWALPGAIGVMLAGLPVIGITWYVQRVAHRAYTVTPQFTPGGSTAPQGTMATLAMKAVPHVSWRRTWLGGSIAVGGFVALIIAFMVMRAMGVGPFGSLRGKGAFGDRETIVVADFRSPANDTTLGGTVAEALRTDLGQSNSLKVLTRANMRDLLAMMQRPRESVVAFDVAREIATREGAKAVLDGEVVQLGKGYVVSARLVNALDGNELVTFRETANGEDDLINALGKLSRAVRERAGESLKNIQKSSELERVSTPSLAALRKYVQGSQASDEQGDADRAIQLLQEAVAIDSGFAMAWRKLAVVLGNEGNDRPRQLAAIEASYRHRGRLTEMERLLTEGYYFMNGPKPDYDKALTAYESALQIDSASTSALNNAAVVYGRKREYAKAEALYRRVIALPRTFGGAFTNLLQEQIRNGHLSGLDSTLAAYRTRLPNSNDLWEAEWYTAYWGAGNRRAADSIGRAVYARAKTVRQSVRGAGSASGIALLEGRARESLHWATLATNAQEKAQPGPDARFSHVLDTVFTLTTPLERMTEARAALTRGMARVPMSSIPAAQRPWVAIARLGAQMRDPALARQAKEGWERDQASMAPDKDGRRAMFESQVAFAEGRYGAAIEAMRTADARYEVNPYFAINFIAQSFDLANQPDSAITYFERYVSTPDPQLSEAVNWMAGSHKRLGELYDAKGNKAKAIEHFEKFVELWKNADPELQPKVREAQDKLKRLRGMRG